MLGMKTMLADQVLGGLAMLTFTLLVVLALKGGAGRDREGLELLGGLLHFPGSAHGGDLDNLRLRDLFALGLLVLDE